MISTFDLTLLGSCITVGGIMFLRQGKWPHLGSRWLTGGKLPIELTLESREHHERSTTIVGTRWLTVGALILLVAYTHGGEKGYLFGPWGDVIFHVIFVSTSWGLTAFRIKQAFERSVAVALPDSSICRTSD